jgi:tetratricopeptide (TPR) repeat protein
VNFLAGYHAAAAAVCCLTACAVTPPPHVTSKTPDEPAAPRIQTKPIRDIRPKSVSPQIRRQVDEAYYLSASGRHQDARRILINLTKNKSSHQRAIAFSRLSLLYADQGKYKDARQTARKAVSLFPREGRFYYNLAFILEKQGKINDAIDTYKSAVRYAPAFRPAHMNVGFLHLRQEKWVPAKKAFANAHRLQAGEQSLFFRGYCSYQLGQYRHAADDFRTLRDQLPQAHPPHYYLGMSLLRSGEYKRALPSLQQAARLCRDNRESLRLYTYNLGLCYFHVGRYQESIRRFDTAIRLKSGYINAYINRSRAFIKTGEYTRSLSDLNTVIGRSPQAHYYFLRARLHHLYLQQPDAALRDYNTALNKKKNHRPYHYWRALLRLENKRPQEAYHDLQKSSQDPPHLQYQLVRLYALIVIKNSDPIFMTEMGNLFESIRLRVNRNEHYTPEERLLARYLIGRINNSELAEAGTALTPPLQAYKRHFIQGLRSLYFGDRRQAAISFRRATPNTKGPHVYQRLALAWQQQAAPSTK